MIRVRYVGTIRLFLMVRLRYVLTLLEFAYLTFYAQRAAVNEDSCYRTLRAHSLGYSQVIIIAS